MFQEDGRSWRGWLNSGWGLMRQSQISGNGEADASVLLSEIFEVKMPIRLPSVSNSPPPDEPGDMASIAPVTGVVAGAYGRFLIASIRRSASSCAELISVSDK